METSSSEKSVRGGGGGVYSHYYGISGIVSHQNVVLRGILPLKTVETSPRGGGGGHYFHFFSGRVPFTTGMINKVPNIVEQHFRK